MEIGQENPDELKRQIDDLLHHQFKPEFLNRVDEIITFQSLTRDDLTQIVDIQIKRMVKRLQELKFSLTLTKEAKQFLVETGYDPAYGARPLKRAIQRYIEDPLAMEILEGNFVEGDHIRVDKSEKNHLTFCKQS